jgi:hypothetical protein
MSSTNQIPAHGQVIIFTKVPTCSYCSTGEAYRVTRGTVTKKGKRVPSDYFHFDRVNGAGSTSDKAWAVAQSEWRVA